MSKKNSVLMIVVVVMLMACGPYQKALKNDDVKPKYDLAIKYYKEGLKTGKNSRFKRTIRLLEQILPQYRGKPQGEKLAYIYADSYYHLEDYLDAGYQFERFTKSYSKSDKAEDAAFKGAKSYYYVSPKYSLDQNETKKALRKLQGYISDYPSGEHLGEANQIVASLRSKLEKKDFEIARLYYYREEWKAAISAMGNFIDENPGSEYLEKAYLIRVEAEHTLAINSFRDVMKDRLQKTEKFTKDYLKYYPEGDYIDKVKSISDDVNTRLNDF